MIFFLLSVTLFLIFLSVYGLWIGIHPPKYTINLTPSDMGWQYQDVVLTTSDGLKLAAWFVPAVQQSDKVIIMLHGYPVEKADLLDWASFLHQEFNLLFFDFRYFGKSQGSYTSLGYHEQKDLLAAIDYLKTQGYKKIGVMGFSFGAAVAILTAAQTPDIKAIVADSAFANITLMGYEFYKEFFFLKYPLTFLTKLWAKIILNIDPDSIAPEMVAPKLTLPILLIHSQDDKTVPFENALRLQKALQSNPNVELFFYNTGTHGMIPEDLLEKYQTKILSFFRKWL